MFVIGSFFAFANQAQPSTVHTSTSVGEIIEPVGAGQPPSNWSSSTGPIYADTSYSPDTVVVVIGVNNTITWVNQDSAPHTVTFTVVPSGVTATIDSGEMVHGAAFTYTFQISGTYLYGCTYHPWMGGKVIVKNA